MEISDRPAGHPSTVMTTNWGSWSSWTPCPVPCNEWHTQNRHRLCLFQDSAGSKWPTYDISPCLVGSEPADVQVEKCQCRSVTVRPRSRLNMFLKPPGSMMMSNVSSVVINGIERSCGECQQGEVCVARVDEVVPVCRWPVDPDDPTGCGGFCRLDTDVCARLGNRAYR